MKKRKGQSLFGMLCLLATTTLILSALMANIIRLKAMKARMSDYLCHQELSLTTKRYLETMSVINSLIVAANTATIFVPGIGSMSRKALTRGQYVYHLFVVKNILFNKKCRLLDKTLWRAAFPYRLSGGIALYQDLLSGLPELKKNQWVLILPARPFSSRSLPWYALQAKISKLSRFGKSSSLETREINAEALKLFGLSP
jgi:hypothetical protein